MNQNHQKIFTNDGIPKVVIGLALTIGLMEIMFSLGKFGVGLSADEGTWRLMAIRDFGVWQPILDQSQVNGESLPRTLLRLVTFPFIDYNFMGAAFGFVFTLAIGKFIGRFISQVGIIGIFFSASIIGALCYGFIFEEQLPLLGASPGYFGFLGGYFAISILAIELTNSQRNAMMSMPLMLLGLQLFVRIFFGGPNFWVADLGGFITGIFGAVIARFGFIKGCIIVFELLNKRGRK